MIYFDIQTGRGCRDCGSPYLKICDSMSTTRQSCTPSTSRKHLVARPGAETVIGNGTPLGPPKNLDVNEHRGSTDHDY